mgnify:CR=1 FL=1
MGRRGAGEGSIFRDKATGRWRALLDVGEDAAGRRRRRKVSGRTRAEVAAKLRELQRDLEDGVSSAGRHGTVSALSDDWLRQRSGELAASTLEVRNWAVNQHIVPALGARRVRELSAEDVARFLQDLAAAGYVRATLDKLRGVLVQVLRHAERQGLVVRNVAALVPTPAGPRTAGRSLTKTASSRRQLRLPPATAESLRRPRLPDWNRHTSGPGEPAPRPATGHREGRTGTLAPARAEAQRGQPAVRGRRAAGGGGGRPRTREHAGDLADVPAPDDADDRSRRGPDGAALRIA